MKNTLLLSNLLTEQLRVAQMSAETHYISKQADQEFLAIPDAGKTISSAYEQLRNAAENSEEHLILQKAIKRFYKLNIFTAQLNLNKIGTELASDLILAGYMQNGSVSRRIINQIDNTVSIYHTAHQNLIENGIKRETATDWTLSLLASETTNLLKPRFNDQPVLAVGFQFFLKSVDLKRFLRFNDSKHIELCLYVAVQQALLRSDIDNVRFDIIKMYQTSPAAVEDFSQLNQLIDRLFTSRLTQRLRQIVSRNGSAMRVLRGMLSTHTPAQISDILVNQDAFAEAFRQQAKIEYRLAKDRLNSGLIKSIAFIFITKTIIGIGIEIPYDLWVHQSIAWTPLIINLMFPPLYLALLRLSVKPPTSQNTRHLIDDIENILYSNDIQPVKIPPERRITPIKQLLYTIIFAIPVAALIIILYSLNFNIVQMIIFFIFFSTASSLGFRFNSHYRDLEVNREHSGFLASVMDFLYYPFVVMGRWLSNKYQQINIVSRFLDVVIELPLKAVLRLVRQWIRFLDDAREQLY